MGAMLFAACVDEPTEPAWEGEGASSGAAGTSGAGETGGASGSTSPGSPQTVSTVQTTPDDSSDASTGGPPPQPSVDVAHEREFRAAWIATVSNINYPSSTGLSVEQQQAELRDLLDVAAAHRLNAVIFQVRPESDALYDSELEPWSRFLTGTQGGDPGFDPLTYLIEQAHPMAIEVHAWVNPYRAKSSLSSTLADGHIALEQSAYAYPYGNLLWMDPGAEAVQERTIDVVLDLVDRYDLDGVHFDDYFYPYPNGDTFPDSSTYGAYQDGGGTLSLEDWRRDNVNVLVEVLYESIVGTREHIRFGISPFGIYRPGMPEGIVGLDQYAEIYADPLLWMDEGWVDYLAPQLYWPTTQAPQAYEPLLEWWSSMTSEGRYIFTGNYLSQVGSSSAWSVNEVLEQVEISRTYRALGSMGNIYFHIGPLQEDTLGVGTALVEDYYDVPALTPVLAARRDDVVEQPYLEVLDGHVEVSPRDDTPLRSWVVYREVDGAYVLHDIVPATQQVLMLDAGSWAISAAARSGVESRGVLVEL